MTTARKLCSVLMFAATLVAASCPAGADDGGGATDGWRLHPYGWVEGALSTSPLTESGSRTARVFDVEDDGPCFDLGENRDQGSFAVDILFTF